MEPTSKTGFQATESLKGTKNVTVFSCDTLTVLDLNKNSASLKACVSPMEVDPIKDMSPTLSH